MSNINPYNIDNTFPVAGQDNSSQGFRDNFTNIKNNLLFAQQELNDLQSKAIVTNALTGQAINNDMAGTYLTRPQLKAWTQALLDLGNVSTAAVLDFNSANFQKVTTQGSINVSFINWPSSYGAGAVGYGVMRVWFKVTDKAHAITLPGSVQIDIAEVAGATVVRNLDNTIASSTITFDIAGDYIFDFSSIDGGTTYFIQDITRNRSTLRDSNLYFNEAVTTTPTLFVGFGQNGATTASVEFARLSDQGQNIVSAVGSYNSVSFGNLSLANTTTATIDTGKISGYTITTARGNLAANVYTPVKSGDYLGYFNAVSYSGYAGVANVFQQMSSIAFYATGSNVAYGLGGNIAFFTSQDGGVAQHGVIQGLGIENDQSVKVFGNLIAVGTATIGGAITIGGATSITGATSVTGAISATGNASVGGNLTIGSTIIKNGTYFYTLATTNTVPIIANSAIITIVIDSASSATINWANITLPSNPADRQTIKISTAAPITNANVYGGAGVQVKWVPTGKFSTGNVAVELTYQLSNTTWYVS